MWTTDEVTLLKQYYPSFSKEEIKELFPDKPYSTIVAHANALKIQKILISNKLNKLLNNSNESWYWLGFILADGYLGPGQLKLSCSEKDKEQLQKFCDYIEYDKITKFINNNGFGIGNVHYKVNIGNYEILNKIKEVVGLPIECTNKTYNPPNLSFLYSLDEDSFFSLFAGYIDGDGCVYKNNIRFSIHENWKLFLTSCCDIANNFIYSIPKADYYERIPKEKAYSLTIKVKLTIKIHEKIQKLKLPVLSRKWNKIKYTAFNKIDDND